MPKGGENIMGADLYINMLFEKSKAKYQPILDEWVRKRDEAVDEQAKDVCQKKVEYYYDKMYSEGYFRDSYNDTNLLWLFGLDYWTYFESLMTKKSTLTPAGAKKLLDEMKSRELTFFERVPERVEKLRESGSKDSAESWHDYFYKKYDEFKAFLQRAIDLKSDIYCSV